MGFGNIKIDRADKLFSIYIRLRDKECIRCHSQVKINDKGLPVSHQASHYHGRGKESTRFDPLNVDCLCTGCHMIWGSNDKEGYREFKIRQLGENGFNVLLVKANTPAKKDRKIFVLYYRQVLKDMGVSI